MQNLFGNALKCHRPGAAPRVQVSARTVASEQEEKCELRVCDNGIGFEAGEAERVFAPFARLHERHAYEGTGMGLSICKRIAERHSGTIAAQSTPGQGACFFVTLPFKQ